MVPSTFVNDPMRLLPSSMTFCSIVAVTRVRSSPRFLLSSSIEIFEKKLRECSLIFSKSDCNSSASFGSTVVSELINCSPSRSSPPVQLGRRFVFPEPKFSASLDW